ncbi:uncharacterized protein V1513DRAFT_446641 [Lipomyces chichibuensis]|uniref:uncharacterized protein n=1 Tax=Lipomyces chichibuensis TaxID=1546026 RepID=UPI0033431F31
MAQVAAASARTSSSSSAPPSTSATRPKFAPTSSTIPLANACADIARRVDSYLATTPASESADIADLRQRTKERVRESLGVINEALRRYSIDELAISFNGGKDCLAMLVLLLASLHYHSSQFPPQRIHTVYVHSLSAFPEVDAFVNDCATLYSLDLIRLPTPMKAAFQKFLDAKPDIKAIMVGTRRTDPNGADLTYFDETDHGWPKFMRVHPVIDWHYAEVWQFLRELDIKYCILYDLGYTSLGGTTDTHPNPALLMERGVDSTGEQSFKPAYTLIDDDKERWGRNT